MTERQGPCERDLVGQAVEIILARISIQFDKLEAGNIQIDARAKQIGFKALAIAIDLTGDQDIFDDREGKVTSGESGEAQSRVPLTIDTRCFPCRFDAEIRKLAES